MSPSSLFPVSGLLGASSLSEAHPSTPESDGQASSVSEVETEPFPELPEPLLNSATLLSPAPVVPQGPSLVFPNHYNGHFLGVLDDAQPILAGYNFPILPAATSLPTHHNPQHPTSSASWSQRPFQTASDLLLSTSMSSHASNSWVDVPNQDLSDGDVDRFDDGTSEVSPHLGNAAIDPADNSISFGTFTDPHVGQAYNLTTPAPGTGQVNSNLTPPQDIAGFAIDFSQQASQYSTFDITAASYLDTAEDPFLDSGIPPLSSNLNFGRPQGVGYVPTYRQQFIQGMPYNSMGFNMANMNTYPSAASGGFLEATFVDGRLITPALPPGVSFSFDINNPPPFIDITGFVWPSDKPVVKILNIPFQSSQEEIRQFMRRFFLPYVPDDSYGPSHIVAVNIIQERTNAKTQDCFVEVADTGVKRVVLSRYNAMMRDSRAPRMGNRIISVEDSNQAELMHEIFSRANCILWETERGFPILKTNNDAWRSGFFGFLTHEELFLLVRYTTDPDRNPYSGKCLQRTFESMMMILIKFPWASPYYSVNDRNEMFRAYLIMLKHLAQSHRVVGLGSRMLEAFGRAGLDCPGFGEWQKDQIIAIVGDLVADHGVSSHAFVWPFECLGKPPGVSDQDLTMWLELLTSGAKEALKDVPDNIWVTDKFRVGPTQFGGVKFEMQEGAEHFGVHDLARFEYSMMMYLINVGWSKWFSARGLDAELSPYPAAAFRRDQDLHKKMVALGIFTQGGIRTGNERQEAAAALNRAIIEAEALVNDDLDNVLAREDAIARDLSQLEDASLAQIEAVVDVRLAERPPTLAANQPVIDTAPVTFNNPFGGPLHGSNAALGSLQFGSFGPSMTDASTKSTSISSNIAPETVPDARISTGRRANKAIPIVKPSDALATRGSTQDPIGTPSRRESSQVSSETIAEEGTDKDAIVMVSGAARKGKKSDSV